MSDFLLELGRQPAARASWSRPWACPSRCPRRCAGRTGPGRSGRWPTRRVVVGGAPGGDPAGRRCWRQTLVGRRRQSAPASASVPPAFRELGEAYGRPPRTLDVAGAARAPDAPTRWCSTPPASSTPRAAARALRLLPAAAAAPGAAAAGCWCWGARPTTRPTRCEAAARAALDGFVRSLAKEIGKRGATAHLLVVEPGAEERLAPGAALPAVGRARRSSPASRCASTALAAGNGEPRAGAAARGQGGAGHRRRARHRRGHRAAAGRGGRARGLLDRPADDGPASQVARAIGGSVLLVDVSRSRRARGHRRATCASTTAASTSWSTTPASPATRRWRA